MIDLEEIIEGLSSTRPVFHSEADFQHALAWEIHKQSPDCSIRLEYKPLRSKRRYYVDIWCVRNGFIIAIELKYKTKDILAEVRNEIFDLKDQSAQDHGRYDFLRDIQRLEEIGSGERDYEGYGIFLTNDSLYWGISSHDRALDTDFHIHEGRMLTGELNWRLGASEGTIKNRKEAIHLKNAYSLKWRDYSKLTTVNKGRFRYLFLKVKGG